MHDYRSPDLREEPKLGLRQLIIHSMLVNGCDIASSQKLVLRAMRQQVLAVTTPRHEWLWITHRKSPQCSG
jgi:hypothetical protein